MNSRALVCHAPGVVALDTCSIDEPGPDEVLIETAFSCVSPGTELRCLSGMLPPGASFPYIPGYALSGHVCKRGQLCTIPIGTPVFAGGTSRASHKSLWGGHCAHAVVKEKSVFVLPPALDLRTASLAKLASIAHHGFSLAAPQAHETAVVVGLGVLGQISARLFALNCAKTVCCDTNHLRVKAAVSGGLVALQVNATLEETLKGRVESGADIIVDVTGVPAVLEQCIALCRDLPWDNTPAAATRLVLQGSYAGALSIDYNAAFMKELSLTVSRDAAPRDISAVIELMANGRLDLGCCITSVSGPRSAPDVYRHLGQKDSEALTAVFDWQS